MTCRLLLPSRRLLDPGVWSASAYEFEDTIASVEATEPATPDMIEPDRLLYRDRMAGALGLNLRLGVAFAPRPPKVQLHRFYDVLFVRVMTLEQLSFLQNFPDWRERCKLAVCWVEELWVNWLKYKKNLEHLKQFDHVFVSLSETADALPRYIDRPCSYLAPGVDALRFCPYPDRPRRSIDVYAMGRRSPVTHKSLLEYARGRKNFFYLYDSAGYDEFVEGHAQHRDRVASLIQRTRYFIVCKAKANAPEQTGGQQGFGPRYFEGAAGGAVLIGDAPDRGPFLDYFDWPDALFDVPYGSAEIPRIIDELESQPERVERARRANVTNMLRRHDWLYRWQTVLDTLKLPATPEMAARRAELERRASEIETSAEREDSAVQSAAL